MGKSCSIHTFRCHDMQVIFLLTKKKSHDKRTVELKRKYKPNYTT